MAPYGRVLNSDEQDQGRRGSSGFLGPRTEQFALGSLFYLMNYGFEDYGDRCLTENLKENGRKVVDLLQNMEFPKALLPGRNNKRETNAETFSSKKEFCQSLEKRELLHMLSLGEPEQLGFTIEWYRYSKS
ncbi:hypothetical protein N7516_001855 [Penicillium verrucosum]|uniref:uncharacterized protein n=1 Tax=Penicillium verrucosum TaxID=60171 RepID=UPI00254544A0|nr:uncharacterized protein N7516_001855 [Penicillium verrucosum]KAJ5941687.1 hypothetical protein N7516_001855 [Penicillium verrucosum]